MNAPEFAKRTLGAVPEFLFTTPAKDYNAIFHPVRYFCITDHSLVVFNHNRRLKKGEHSWQSLREFSQNGSQIILQFEHASFTLHLGKQEEFLRRFFDVIQRVLLPSELQQLGINTFLTFTALPTGISIISRIKEKAANLGVRLDQEFIDAITKNLQYSPNIINLNNIPNDETICNIVVDSIPLTRAKQLITSRLPSVDVYKLLLPIALNTAYLRFLEICGIASQSFQRFFSQLTTSSQLELRSISFRESHLTGTEIDILKNFIFKTDLQGVEFHNAVSESSYAYFYNNILPSIGRRLVLLNFDDTPFLNFNSLVKSITGIKLLSVSNCNINLTDAFKVMTQERFSNLRAFRASDNFCSPNFPIKLHIPHMVNTLIIDNVKWEGSSLTSFAKMIFEQACFTNLHLSLANADTPPDQWNTFFIFLSKCKFSSLSSFRWDGNPINPILFDFLGENLHLDKISLSYCFKEEDTKQLSMLLSFLQNPKLALHKIILKSNEQAFLGGQLLLVLKSAEELDLDLFDVSGSRCGDLGYKHIVKFLSQKQPKTFIIDGIRPTSKESILGFMEYIANNHLNTQVSFPLKDVEHLTNIGALTEADVNLCKSFYAQPAKKPQQLGASQFQPITDSYFDTPFNIFVAKDDDWFPHYLSNKMIAQMHEIKLHPPVSPVTKHPIKHHSLAKKPLESVPNREGNDHSMPIDHQSNMSDDEYISSYFSDEDPFPVPRRQPGIDTAALHQNFFSNESDPSSDFLINEKPLERFVKTSSKQPFKSSEKKQAKRSLTKSTSHLSSEATNTEKKASCRRVAKRKASKSQPRYATKNTALQTDSTDLTPRNKVQRKRRGRHSSVKRRKSMSVSSETEQKKVENLYIPKEPPLEQSPRSPKSNKKPSIRPPKTSSTSKRAPRRVKVAPTAENINTIPTFEFKWKAPVYFDTTPDDTIFFMKNSQCSIEQLVEFSTK